MNQFRVKLSAHFSVIVGALLSCWEDWFAAKTEGQSSGFLEVWSLALIFRDEVTAKLWQFQFSIGGGVCANCRGNGVRSQDQNVKFFEVAANSTILRSTKRSLRLQSVNLLEELRHFDNLRVQ